MGRDPRESTSEHKRGSRYEPTISRTDLNEAKTQAAVEARRDMITEQLVNDQKKTSLQIAEVSATLIKINAQADRCILTAEAATSAANANTQAIMEHMANHPSGVISEAQKSESWVKPIVIQVLGTLATAIALGGLYASFFVQK